jgi:hypothetical protein
LIAAAILAACALGAGSADTDIDPEKWQELVSQMGDTPQEEDALQTDASAAPSESALPEPVSAADPQEQIIAYLSGLFDEAFTPYYEGLHYAMSGCEEAVTPGGDYTATFHWTMYNKDNGLDVASDFGKETEGNFFLQATARFGADGLLDLVTIEILADNSMRGPANYVVPIEDFFPPKPEIDPLAPSPVPAGYSGGKTFDDAQLLAGYFVEMLNSGFDLTGRDGAIEAWRERIDFSKMPAEARNLRDMEFSDDIYIFDVVGTLGDTITETPVQIVLQDTLPRYTCEYTRYYPFTLPTVEHYLSLLARGNQEALARFLIIDGEFTSMLDEAKRHLGFYSKYDLASAKISGPITYDNDRHVFDCVIEDKNGDSFVVVLVCGDSALGITPP